MSKRPLCPNCGYILVRCLCDALKPIDNHTHLIVLQHPNETSHPLNTVKLMAKSFQKITIFIGEDFTNHDELNTLIKEHKNTIALIYPNPNNFILNSDSKKKISHLILIDGTWRKAQKIFISSINLLPLSSFKIETTKSSQYKIRSSKKSFSLSTLEATVEALTIIEENLETKSLTRAFNKLIEFQINKMGEKIFNKNYNPTNQE